MLSNLSEYKHINIKKNNTLFYEGDFCNTVGLVKSGEIKISSFLANGNEVIFNVINEGGLFGNNLIFSNNPYYKGNVIATLDSEVILLTKNELISLLQNDKQFLIDYFNKQSDFTIELNFKIKLLSFENANDRFLYFLEYHHNKYTYKSITDLSSLLYLKRETVSRLINKMIKNNEIIVKNKTIELK